ncbi:MAG: glycosylhydrolase-like jelly roll fold domain-containing protein [Terrimicrobiaceae bacterium]
MRTKPAASTATLQSLRKIFSEPPREFSPVPIWWWSGERLELDRLLWQLDQLVAGGIYNVIILNLAPAGPLYGKDADDPPFMSEEWWVLFLAVCGHAKKLGARIWFYDQIGFSGANFQGQLCVRDERCRGRVLDALAIDLEGPGQAEFPAAAEPLAAFASELDENGLPSGTPREMEIEGRIVRCAMPGRHRLRLVYALTGGFDYFHRASCDLLMDTIHGEFERRAGHHFGGVIVGSFQDELPSMPTWGRDFARLFRERAGYDLRPLLWALWEGDAEEARRVRLDYQRVRADLAEEAFFRPFYDWHKSRGLTCGFDQQGGSRGGDPIDTVKQYADYLRTHRWYDAPGSDHHGEARIHSSLAEHYGRPRVWIEAFHSTGWGGMPEETFDWLLPWWLAGANLYNPHAIYYSTRGGWWEWAPPSTCWRQPWWRHYRYFAEAASRVSALLAQGGHRCEIAVLHPTTTVQAFLTKNDLAAPAQAANKIYTDIVGTMSWFAPRTGVIDSLDFNILDDDTLQRGQAAGGRLAAAASSYSTIILPGCRVLEEASAKALARFVENGGRLIAVGVVPGSAELKPLFDAGRALFVAAADDLPSLLKETPRALTASVPARCLRLGDTNLAFLPLAHPGATQLDSLEGKVWWNATYTFDPARYRRPMTVTIHEPSIAVELWDPVSGKQSALPTRPVDGGTEVELPEDTPPAVFLVWTENGGSEKTAMPAWTEHLRLPERWEAALEPTLDNRHGDLSRPAHPGPPPLQTWDFKHREEREKPTSGWQNQTWPEGSFDIAHATFGVQGWMRGPVAADDLRPPGQGDDWRPAVYSLSRGIWRDPQHECTLGPSGHVAEHFLDFGPMRNGQAAQFATSVWMDEPREIHFALAAPGARTVTVNGVAQTESTPSGHAWLHPVRLRAGWNAIEWNFIAEENRPAYCHWALVADPSHFRRPSYLTSADAPQKGAKLVFSREFEMPFDATEGKALAWAANSPCTIVLDGTEIGRLGGFMPYGAKESTVVIPLGPLARGKHRVELHATDGLNPAEKADPDSGARSPVLVLLDAEWRNPAGQIHTLASGPDWLVSRDGDAPRPVGQKWHWMVTPALLRHRPHPLPRAHWLEDAPADGTVLDVRPAPFGGDRRADWFQWTLPPGAASACLPVDGTGSLWVDGEPVEIRDGKAPLPRPRQNGRTATLRVESTGGSSGGGLFDAPVSYDMESGELALGDWTKQGLESYSGGVRYRAGFDLAETGSRRWMLDLGRVRGTVEVWVNGQNAGVRFLAPFRFEITELVRAGKNEIEVLVCNSLAPYLAGHSPTNFAFAHQCVSGLFGPVTVLAEAAS